MAANRWLVVLASGEFREGGFYEPARPLLADGVTPDSAYDVLTLPSERMPDRRLERYDGTSQARIRAATSAELAAYDSALKDSQSVAIDADLLIQAVAQLDFEERQKLQVKAGQTLLTGAQAKARVKAIYRSLLG